MRTNPFSRLWYFLHSPTVVSWYELIWPKELQEEQVSAWLHAIGGSVTSQGIRFVTIAEKKQIKHYLALPCQHEQAILATIGAFLPDVELISYEPIKITAKTAAKVLMTSKQRLLNINYPDISSFAILSALQRLASHEQVILLWILGPTKSPAAVPSNTSSFHTGTMLGALGEALQGGVPTKLDAVAIKSMRAKHAGASWKATLYIGITTESVKRKNQLLNSIVGALKVVEAPGVRLGSQTTSTKRLSGAHKPLFYPLVVSVDELLALLSWPLGNRTVAGLTRVLYRRLPLPKPVSGIGLDLADSVFTGSTEKLVLPLKDRMTHLQILGPTNSGKSTLMLNSMLQDAKSGYGFAFIDFKGDLVNDFLKRVPEERIPDLVVIDLQDITRPIGINPLAYAGKNANLIADDILAIFRKLYGSYLGPRSMDLLHSGLLSLLYVPGFSICELPALFTDAEFRRSLVMRVHDPILRDFWESFEKRSPADQNTITAPLMNKLRPFLLRKSIRLSLGQSAPKFDVSEVFNSKRKILLVNLSKATIGSEASQLFGSFVITQILQAIRKRATLPPEKRRPAFLYIDEVQEYWRSNDDFNEALEQFRSNNVGLIFAHQYLGQLAKEKRDGLTNARSKVAFQLSHEDAVVMARTSTVLTPEDFENLPRYHIYAQLAYKGEVLPWVSGITSGPDSPINNPEHILALSREQYGTPASEIENEQHSMRSSLCTTPLSKLIGYKKRGAK